MYDQNIYDKLLARRSIDPFTGCWNWTGPRFANRKYPGNRYGYATIKYRGKWHAKAVHRAMWVALHDDPGPKMCVCHKCDNPLCMNPDHLFLGTHKDNMADSRKKGRHFLSAKTHCKRGHPLSGENLYVCKNGLRHCKACERANKSTPEALAKYREYQRLKRLRLKQQTPPASTVSASDGQT